MTSRHRTSLYSSLEFHERSLSLWCQTGTMLLGSAEVMGRRMEMMNNPKVFPTEEFYRMWHEKFVASLSLYSALCGTSMGAVPIMLGRSNSLNTATKLLANQIAGLGSALKPYRRAVKANQVRLRNRA